MRKNILLWLVIGCLSILFFSFVNGAGNTTALADNSSIEAQSALTAAQECFNDLAAKNIPIKRTNESLEEALQLYQAQRALEEKDKKADYNLVLERAVEVCDIQKTAVKANDELQVFKESYDDTSKNTNLSEMQKEYSAILTSFQDERFEDTLKLINEGYKRLSEIESSQTTLKLYYDVTKRTIKDFFKENWKILSIITFGVIAALIIFWKTLKRLKIKSKLRNLELQKKTLYSLIKNLQHDYFETKKISELEFNIKFQSFKEMIRDIDRQVPLLREEITKIAKNGKDLIKDESEVKTFQKRQRFHTRRKKELTNRYLNQETLRKMKKRAK